jgi:two-component system, OmpR family, sensor kinase
VVAILVVAALGLAASGVASYLVQRKGVLATVDEQLLHTVPSLKAIAAGETTGAPVTSVDSVLRLGMQNVVPGSNESMLGFIDGKPALVPAVNLPHRQGQRPGRPNRLRGQPDACGNRHCQEPARNPSLPDHSGPGRR